MAGTVAGVDRLLADLGKLEDLVGDLRPVWPLLARMWADRERDVFAGGANWAPFAARTLIDHQRTGKPPMVSTRSLIAAMTSPTPRFADEDMAVFGPPKAAKDATKVGARHVRGTAYMPARRLVPQLTAAERRWMVEQIRRHIAKGLP